MKMPVRSETPLIVAPMMIDELRRLDPERYAPVLYAPPALRPALWSIACFNTELARIRGSVSQPLLGQIRLSWWRESLTRIFQDDPTTGHPVVEALAACRQVGLIDREALFALLDARESELLLEADSDLASTTACGAASGEAFTAARLYVLGLTSPEFTARGRTLGTAHAIIGIIREIPVQLRLGKIQMPADVAARAGLDLDLILRGESGSSLHRAVSILCDVAQTSLDGLPDLKPREARMALPALADGMILRRVLKRIRAADYNPLDPRLSTPDPLLSWRLGAAWLRGQY